MYFVIPPAACGQHPIFKHINISAMKYIGQHNRWDYRATINDLALFRIGFVAKNVLFSELLGF